MDYSWVISSIIGLYPHQLNTFSALPARLKQGMLNTLVLAHLMKQGQLNSLLGHRTERDYGARDISINKINPFG